MLSIKKATMLYICHLDTQRLSILIKYLFNFLKKGKKYQLYNIVKFGVCAYNGMRETGSHLISVPSVFLKIVLLTEKSCNLTFTHWQHRKENQNSFSAFPVRQVLLMQGLFNIPMELQQWGLDLDWDMIVQISVYMKNSF